MGVSPTSMEQSPENAELVRVYREAKGWSQTELAKRVGTNQQTIEKIESGKTKRSSFLPQIFSALGIKLELLAEGGKFVVRGGESHGVLIGPESLQVSGQKDLPVYGAAQGGSSGALILSTDPVEFVARPHPLMNVRDAYGIIVVEDSMSPEFEPGDIALVHTHLPPAIGHTCVFYAEREDGTVEALIKRLRRVAADAWQVRQWNPLEGEKADFSLKKSEWQKCHLTVGRYSRR